MKALSLILFPLLVMVVSILLQGGNLQNSPGSGGQSVNFCPTGGTNCVNIIGSGSSSGQSFTNLSCAVTIFTLFGCDTHILCAVKGGAIWWPLWCNPITGTLWLPPGSKVSIPNIVTSSSIVGSTVNNAVFNFESIGLAGFIVIFTTAVGVAAIAGITVVSSGVNAASIRIIFLGGSLMGLWAILAGFEGALNPFNNASFFHQVDTATTGFNLGSLGSIFFVLLSLLYVTGAISFCAGLAGE